MTTILTNLTLIHFWLEGPLFIDIKTQTKDDT